MKTLTQLITELLSDHQWHSSKEITRHCLKWSDKDRHAIHNSLHNMTARNQIKRRRKEEDDTEAQYRLPDASGFGVSERLALLDQYLRKARDCHAL